MHKLLSSMLTYYLVFFNNINSVNKNSEIFPKRKYYPNLKYIDTQALIKGLQNGEYEVIDVRDEASYETRHIVSATHIFINSTLFNEVILNSAAQNNKSIVVYSNNISCSKSYIASTRIMELFEQHGIKNTVLTYDAGIYELASIRNKLVKKIT